MSPNSPPEIRRAQIAVHGMRIVRDVGFPATTHQAVAASIGISERTVYHYAGDRMALWRMIATHAQGQGLASVVIAARRLGIL